MYSEATGPKSSESLERLGFKCLKRVKLCDVYGDVENNPWKGSEISGGFYERSIDDFEVV